ncbi:hypothetical protein B0H10DRAFT_1955382 [Mycena sp. CBHHK59/15]|nr:hypothetical protein B0H10DRAFT_1955382 [Mycena sp. CBHHK59/15]
MASPTPIPAASTFALECLGNIDLLCQVLQHRLDLGPDVRHKPNTAPVQSIAARFGPNRLVSKNPLVDIVLTCKALSEPALDFLGGNLTSLVPLLKLLPSFTMTLLGPLNAADFIRFDYHTGRSDETIRDGVVFTTFLSVAAHSAPLALDNLVLEGIFPLILFDLIPRFHNLQRLEIGDIDQSIEFKPFVEILKTMSESTHITTLVLRDVPALDDAPNGPFGEFPVLNRLEISGGFHFIYELISGLGTSQLQDITLSFKSEPNWRFGQTTEEEIVAQWRSLFDLISGRWDSSLERIVVDIGNHHRSAGFMYLFQRFCSIQNLHEFRLLSWPLMDMEEQDIITLAFGCPSIEILGMDISWERDWNNPALPSINCLTQFADHCPPLVQLEISLDLRRDIGNETPSVSAHGLKNIIIHNRHGNLTTCKTQAIVQFLDTTFLKLESMRHTQHIQSATYVLNLQHLYFERHQTVCITRIMQLQKDHMTSYKVTSVIFGGTGVIFSASYIKENMQWPN